MGKKACQSGFFSGYPGIGTGKCLPGLLQYPFSGGFFCSGGFQELLDFRQCPGLLPELGTLGLESGVPTIQKDLSLLQRQLPGNILQMFRQTLPELVHSLDQHPCSFFQHIPGGSGLGGSLSLLLLELGGPLCQSVHSLPGQIPVLLRHGAGSGMLQRAAHRAGLAWFQFFMGQESCLGIQEGILC